MYRADRSLCIEVSRYLRIAIVNCDGKLSLMHKMTSFQGRVRDKEYHVHFDTDGVEVGIKDWKVASKNVWK